MKPFMKSRQTVCLMAALVLTGCTAQKLQPAQVDSIRSVGVVSLLPTELRYAKIGVTVFNNEFQSQHIGDGLNEAARKAAEAALQRAPSRNVLQLRDGITGLSARYYAKSLVMSDSTERIQDALSRLARDNRLDAIAVIGEVFDSDQGRAGVRVFLRAGIGDVQSASILPDVVVHVVDGNGKALAVEYARPVRSPATRAGTLPWEYRLEANLDPLTRAKLSSDMQQAISANVTAKFEKLGF